jgi:ATPase subunit of ABC transporter with duplicated ATPase domains
MATEPDIVLADELTNHLDFQAIAVVKNWMQTCRSSFLLIDHNSEFLSLFNNFLFLPNNKSRKTLYYPNQSFDQVISELEKLEKSQLEDQQIILKRKKALEKQLEHLQFRAEVFNADIGSAARSIRKKNGVGG